MAKGAQRIQTTQALLERLLLDKDAVGRHCPGLTGVRTLVAQLCQRQIRSHTSAGGSPTKAQVSLERADGRMMVICR